MTGDSVIDIDYSQQAKHGQFVAGDVFATRKIKAEGRIIAVLSDGLGSGVKASVLANLTATMALKYTASFVDVRQSARTIMDTLPVCEVRKISYSTFTIVDTDADGNTRVIEHGNPDFILLRGGRAIDIPKSTFTLEQWRDRVIAYSAFQSQLGDRIVCCSDGVTQSGLGRAGFPLGWQRDNVVRHVRELVEQRPDLSAQRLARAMIDAALRNDSGCAKDDITCGVIHLRRPRRLLVITGPPFAKERDTELAELVRSYPGRKAICGGTTATIVSRILRREVCMDLSGLDPEVPPASTMDGVDVITEGTLTLARVASLLESRAAGSGHANGNGRSGGLADTGTRGNAAEVLVELMLDSDQIEFVVGTRINEAHQDPNVPVELDIRRNIVRRIAASLEARSLKTVSIRFV